MKILVIAGTRPEVIKVAPIVMALKKSDDVDVKLCITGQHRELVRQALADFELVPDFHFDLMRPNQQLAMLSADLFMTLDPLMEREKPDWLLIQGDTTTVMASALCAFYHNIRIGHIEAGLRTYQRRSPFPEEMNRQIVSRLADLHFTPTESGTQNLINEGIDPSTITMTGNTAVDSLLYINRQVEQETGLVDQAVAKMLETGKRMVLMTGHRRENFGKNFQSICMAILELANMHKDTFFVYPVHLNPNVQEPVYKYLNGHPRIILLPPLSYKNFIALLGKAYLVLTDSGGIQEEAPSLGKPVLVMRESTERTEGVMAGVAVLVGTKPKSIIRKTTELLTDKKVYERMVKAANPYGDGNAAERIISSLMKYSIMPSYCEEFSKLAADQLQN